MKEIIVDIYIALISLSFIVFIILAYIKYKELKKDSDSPQIYD